MVRVGPFAPRPLAPPFFLVVVATVGCARSEVPDPRAATAEYARAVSRNDTQAVYLMLTDEARRAYGIDGTRRLLADARKEILGETAAVTSERARVQAVAEIPYVDGERAVLEVDRGRYRISAAAGLPFGARTPASALAELRSALARRSYAALVRVLSSDARGALESDMRTLVDGLEQPDTLDVKVHGESADVTVPGGHTVHLKREDGVWRVHDFD